MSKHLNAISVLLMGMPWLQISLGNDRAILVRHCFGPSDGDCLQTVPSCENTQVWFIALVCEPGFESSP